jgi:uncharacterized membrane protein YeaQ/YmgE (transglycosylase-associated protein family)
MKKFILWSLAIIITCAAAVYQRHTGPTYPKELKVKLNNKEYDLKLSRSIALDEKSEVNLAIADTSVKARIFYKLLNSKNEYQAVDFKHRTEPKKDVFYAEVPQQPAAGKLQYYIELTDSQGVKSYFKESPVVIRFKGGVPLYILLPHILCMFTAMLFSTLAGLMAAIKFPQYKKYGFVTMILLIIGGMILGCIVQKLAFGDYWTGVPFGWDLTDNKTLIALIFWVLAVIMNRKGDRPVYSIIAAVVVLIVFSIPHSLFGSQLDYSTGQVTQGIILNFF